MAVSDWNEPGLSSSAVGLTLYLSMRRPGNRGCLVMLTPGGDTTATGEDWQALLDHFAKFPGMMTAELREGIVVDRAQSPDVDYEPLPPVNDA